jgi:hypothetical protein
MDLKELEKEIKSVILTAVSKTDKTSIFERVCDVFKSHFEKPAHNITEIKKRTAKSKGNSFEVFCMMYLRAKGYEVWHLSEMSKELLDFLGMQSFDVGIDLVARIKIPNRETNGSSPRNDLIDYFYFPVQVKYRQPSKDSQGRTVHKVGWKDVSTFLSLANRTGPPGDENTKKGWLKNVIMTNAESVCWRGKKSKQDWTIAKGSFEKCDRIFWLKIASGDNKKKENIIPIVIEDEYILVDGTIIKTEKPRIRDLRSKWLDSLSFK